MSLPRGDGSALVNICKLSKHMHPNTHHRKRGMSFMPPPSPRVAIARHSQIYRLVSSDQQERTQ